MSMNVDDTDSVVQHPAVSAWLSVADRREVPRLVQTLKPLKRKSAVYRLVMRSGLTVIGKRCRKETGMVEAAVYEHVLPSVPYPTLRLYGMLDVKDEGSTWLFTEDAGDVRYSTRSEEHRRLAGQWMAALHASSSAWYAGFLPARDSAYRRALLEAALETVALGTANLSLLTEHRTTLRATGEVLKRFENRWSELENMLSGVPDTLVHGGFYGKNVRVRQVTGESVLGVFDWESAGWGPAVIDLVNVDLARYCEELTGQWNEVTEDRLSAPLSVGRVLATLKALSGEAKTLKGPWANKAMGKMTYYSGELSLAAATLEW
jgi:hypothetical protein